ncbi:hypothetical protein GOODEAATRI_009153 [Goodea atripinnis]|uniref:Uncharacterized protein n=1 Tax=Goodea atripinnis TaxID=208336 RepID=A0ABV0PCN3_9TELE
MLHKCPRQHFTTSAGVGGFKQSDDQSSSPTTMQPLSKTVVPFNNEREAKHCLTDTILNPIDRTGSIWCTYNQPMLKNDFLEQELLSHHAGREGAGSWNLCLCWPAGTVTMAQIAPAPRKLQRSAGWQVQETGRVRGNAEPAVPVAMPPTTCNQRAKEPTCHQGRTDGPLLGGCGCNADLRANAVLFAAAHIHFHTTAWQSNMLTFLCQAKYNTGND